MSVLAKSRPIPMNVSILRPGLGILCLLLGVLACSDADPAPPTHTAASTGASCPSGGSALTYGGWAEGFFTAYCVRCHSVTRTSQDERHGAPIGTNWDDIDAIRAFAEDIDSVAASGPKATNRIMPPSGDSPTDEERRMLGEWLACGAPE
jgi:uncharacterized membrane protein